VISSALGPSQADDAIKKKMDAGRKTTG